MYIRFSVQKAANACTAVSRMASVPRVTSRSIYLHRGERVAGLKRDPEEIFKTADGYNYNDIQQNTRHIKDFLQDTYAISDELAMQVITHKSFANGIKPFNEKLSAMGSKLLNLVLATHVITGDTANELAINGKNLDILGQPISREMGSRFAVGIFAKNTKLNSIMFWNSFHEGVSFEASGELKVSAQMIYALIGAVTFTHGKQAAEQFINEKIIGAEPSLSRICKQIIETDQKKRAASVEQASA